MALYAFDGTWNAASMYDDQEQDDETNVARFSETYDGETWYVAGPGTRFGKVGKVVGGVAGAGGFERVEEGYKQLCNTFAAGDRTIDIIGFSRGAALALDFANRIRSEGVRKPGSKALAEENPQIRFLGLWDVVGSFGIPIGRVFNKVNLGHRLSLPESVEYCFHAMAMDERRQTFRVTRLLNAYEVWFRGAHSDVGGGNGNVGLSCIALRWMFAKAHAAGLPIPESAIATRNSKINASAPVRVPKDLIANEYRGFLAGDRFHYTVDHRPDHSNAPSDCLRETEEDERKAPKLSELSKRAEPTAGPPPVSEQMLK
jgi:uncharacterized protein (DUF2235 family)